MKGLAEARVAAAHELAFPNPDLNKRYCGGGTNQFRSNALRAASGYRMSWEIPQRRFAAFVDLTPREEAALKELAAPTTDYARNQIVRHEQDPVDGVYFLVSGWALTSASFAGGQRQILKIHLPGDIMGAPSLALSRAAETIAAATEASISRISFQKLGQIFSEFPRLAMLFFLAAQEERVQLMDRLMIIGGRTARESLAALLVYLHDRLPKSMRGGLPSFEVPLTQSQLGDFLGIHAVHVNRMLRAFESEELIVRNAKWISLPRIADLRCIVGLPRRQLIEKPSWLPSDHAGKPDRGHQSSGHGPGGKL